MMLEETFPISDEDYGVPSSSMGRIWEPNWEDFKLVNVRSKSVTCSDETVGRVLIACRREGAKMMLIRKLYAP